MDGNTLVEALHGRGINVRYLGKLAAMLSTVPQLRYLNRIAVSELIIRSAKHIFISYVQGTELMSLSAAISHFLNCFLSSAQLIHPQQNLEEVCHRVLYFFKLAKNIVALIYV